MVRTKERSLFHYTRGANVAKRKKLRGSHINKYEHLAPKQKAYKEEDKTHRKLPLPGKPGEKILKGLRMLYHGRLYSLMESVVIQEEFQTFGNFELVRYVPEKRVAKRKQAP